MAENTPLSERQIMIATHLLQVMLRDADRAAQIVQDLENEAAKSLTDLENYFDKSDRTTLYRTIKTFEEKGVVHQIDDGTGTTKYALCEQGCNCQIETDLHLHFYCNICDETVCLTDRKIPHINLPDGYTAEDANLVIKGRCEKCPE